MSGSRLDVWPPLPPHVYVRRAPQMVPYPLGEPGCALFELGRHALWHGLATIGLREGHEVLVPAYHHGSEVEALARAGLPCRFYEARDDLAPDEQELARLTSPRTRALYLIHYLGLPQDALRWRRWCDERGLLLIEDAAQAWLASIDGRPVGSFGDLGFFCLYKTLGLPDGGAVVTNARAAARNGGRRLGAGNLVRRHAAWASQRSRLMAAVAGRMERPVPHSPGWDFALGDPAGHPSAATAFLLGRADAGAAAARRLRYSMLLEELGDLVPSPFDKLPAGASPFAFPVTVERKGELLARLGAQGIRALDLWSVPHPSLAPEQFPAATARRRETVALPVHQELSIADVERIARAVRPRRKHGPGLRLEPIDSLESVRPQWTELARRSRNIFATWEWASSWWRHHGIGHALQAFACRSADGGSPVAILPLYLSSSGPLRVVRFIGHGPADQTGPICAPEDRRTVARLMRRLLSDRRGDWDLFLGEQLPRDERWGELLHARVLRREGNPVLRAPGGWEEYLASRSANLRQQMRRRERALAREHELRYRLADDPDRLQADIDTLFALHADRWDGHESRFIAADQAFHREFARHALEQGWLRLWFLELDGCPRAAWYGFRFQGVESYYQAGRDPTWQTRSVGFVLLAHSIRAALQDGVREYRFLRGSEPFKYRFADFDPELETVAVAHGPRGAAALATLAAGVGQAAARRRLAR